MGGQMSPYLGDADDGAPVGQESQVGGGRLRRCLQDSFHTQGPDQLDPAVAGAHL